MRYLKSLLLASSLVAATGCSEEGYVTLFDEDGTWVLIAHDIDNTGTYTPIDSATREDKFLLFFTRTSGEEEIPGGKMAAASCIDENDNQSPVSSSCNRGFQCRCFNYTFNEATFLMKEYDYLRCTWGLHDPEIVELRDRLRQAALGVQSRSELI